MPLVQADQRSPEWFAARAGKITASIAAACLGLDPHKSRAAAWRTVLGIEKEHSNRHMRWGQEFEAQARACYEAETGNIVRETGFWIASQLPWLGASPDGLIDADGLLEVKVPTKLPTAVPVHHKIQMLVQLAVTERQWCDYFVWSHEGHFLERVTSAANEGALLTILAGLDQFRLAFVETAIEPPKRLA